VALAGWRFSVPGCWQVKRCGWRAGAGGFTLLLLAAGRAAGAKRRHGGASVFVLLAGSKRAQ